MDKVDMVFVGAEGVVENGGIVNKVRHLYIDILKSQGLMFLRLVLFKLHL